MLLIEIIASTSTFSYAVLLTKHTKSQKTEGLPPAEYPPDPSNLQFHLRVLIPCYKEKEDVVRRTVVAALEAELPNDTMCTGGVNRHPIQCSLTGPILVPVPHTITSCSHWMRLVVRDHEVDDCRPQGASSGYSLWW